MVFPDMCNSHDLLLSLKKGCVMPSKQVGVRKLGLRATWYQATSDKKETFSLGFLNTTVKIK